MKTIFIIRHAKSSWDNAGSTDHERVLDSRGRHDAPNMAELIKNKGFQVDYMISSDAHRTLETAAYFAKTFNTSEADIVSTNELYHASESIILRVIRSLPQDAQCIMLFAHNPGVTYFANEVNHFNIDDVPTCGILHLEVPHDDWSKCTMSSFQLVDFYYPKMLK